MTRLFLLLLILCSFTCVFGQVGSVIHLDETNGFGGVNLGDTLTNLHFNTIPKLGYSDADRDGIISYYVTDQNILKLNDKIVFDDMMVHYLNKRAYSIVLRFSFNELIDIVDVLKIAYGQPTSEERIDNLYKAVWKGNNILLTLTAYSNGGDNTLSFDNISGIKSLQTKRDESIKKAASKL